MSISMWGRSRWVSMWGRSRWVRKYRGRFFRGKVRSLLLGKRT
ncbi:MAG: hypothetical protein ACM65K_24815 [Microcoleus sp.]